MAWKLATVTVGAKTGKAPGRPSVADLPKPVAGPELLSGTVNFQQPSFSVMISGGIGAIGEITRFENAGKAAKVARSTRLKRPDRVSIAWD